MYDFGARMYMPDLGRFSVIDPMADFVNYQSPYVVSDNNPVFNVDEYGLGIFNLLGNIFRRIGNGIKQIINGKDCSCVVKEDSLYKSWIDPDFPSSGGGRNKPVYVKKTEESGETRGKIPGLTLGSTGLVIGDNSEPEVPEFDILTPPVPSLTKRIYPPSLKKDKIINVDIVFDSFSPKIDYDASRKTLNDLLKTLVDYPQVLLLIQGNVRNRNYPNLKKNTVVDIDGVDGTVGDLQLLRAKAIKKFLVKNGIDPQRLSVGQGIIGENSKSATLKSR